MKSFIELGKKMYDMDNPREVRRMWTFVIRGYLYYGQIKKLDQFFQQNKELRELADIYPFVYEQSTRAFFYNKSTLQERISLVENHMTFMLEKFQYKIVKNIYRRDLLYLI